MNIRFMRFLKKCADRRDCAVVGMLFVASICGAPSKCLAQSDQNGEPLPFERYTLGLGGGIAPVAGTDGNSVSTAAVFQAGGTISFTDAPIWRFKDYKPDHIDNRLSILLAANFMFIQGGISQKALDQAIALNPQNTGLLSATSATAKYFSLTIDPTLRYLVGNPDRDSRQLSLYIFGGYGWFRREIDFTESSNQASVIQPASTGVFAPSASSGAFDAGAGANKEIGRGFSVFVEARVVHGLAVNNGTTLIPISAGLRWGRRE